MRDGVTGIPTEQLIAQWRAAQAAQEADARQSAEIQLAAAQQKFDAQMSTMQQQSGELDTEIKKLQDGSFYTKEQVDALLAGLNVNPFAVGAIYQSTDATSPAALFGGTWEQIAENRVLMGASSSHAAGTTAEAGLPNITGSMVEGSKDQGPFRAEGYLVCEGAFSGVEKSNSYTGHARVTGKNYDLYFDASASNAVYGASDTVQPPAYYVYIWRRVE